MKVASEVGTGAGQCPPQLVSPLEQALDAAVESERHRQVRLARDRAELMRAQLPSWSGSEALALGERRSARLSASVPSQARAALEARPFQRRPAPEVEGWVQLCAVALGLLAMLAALELPVPETLTAPARELRAPTSRAAPASEPAGDVRAPRAVTDGAVTAGEPRQVPAEPVSQTSGLRPAEPRDGASARATHGYLEPRSSVAAASVTRPEPARPSAAPAAPQAQVGTAPLPAKRARVVTVDDMFGIGGDEPLPPEALEDPTSSAPPSPRAHSSPRAAPAAPSSLFYQKPPF